MNGDLVDHHSVGNLSVEHVLAPDETLQSLLDRLSLSSHLNLFQVSQLTIVLFVSSFYMMVLTTCM